MEIKAGSWPKFRYTDKVRQIVHSLRNTQRMRKALGLPVNPLLTAAAEDKIYELNRDARAAGATYDLKYNRPGRLA